MGIAKENRDRKHFRFQFDLETTQQPDSKETALAAYENENRRAEALAVQIEKLQSEIDCLQQALKAEKNAHAHAIQVAAVAADRSHEKYAALLRSFSELREEIVSRKPFCKHEAMLFSEEDGGFLLAHPAHGGLGSFKTLNDARRWAAAHDGFIPNERGYHSIFGAYHRVGFNIWPKEKEWARLGAGEAGR